ncbi:hypothetical protein [Marinobacterium iners]|uniref:hypothetical protein n=1 Tax=Marinobacterium iners TaxID=48076 RepID=UPI001A8F886F|nr:hypothetical protein [Marinobacterium iners]
MDILCNGLRVCVRRFSQFLKPNFSNYWGNWFLAPLMAFFVGFLPVFAFAAVEGDPCVYVDSSPKSYGNTYAEACSGASAYYPDRTYSIDSAGVCRAFYGARTFSLYPKYSSWGSSICPLPTEPECPESGEQFSIQLDAFTGGYPSEYYAFEGCRLVTKVAGCADDLNTGERKCTAVLEFTGDPATGQDEGQCDIDNGCQPAGDPPKKCFSSSGVYIGTVSANASCPFGYTDDPQGEKNCLNPDGTVGYIVNGSASCPEGTVSQDSPRPDRPTDYQNSDGTVDTDGTGDSGATTGDSGTGGGGDPGTGSGSGDTGDNTGEDESGTDCDPTKFGAKGCLNPSQDRLDEIKDAGMGRYMERLKNVPLLQSVEDMVGSVPSGHCSPLNISVAGFWSVTTDIHCVIYRDFSGILSAVFLAGWALLGVRIVLSA